MSLDYFMKEMGPFSQIFANLESMNQAVSNALLESAKVCITNVHPLPLTFSCSPSSPPLRQFVCHAG